MKIYADEDGFSIEHPRGISLIKSEVKKKDVNQIPWVS